MPGQGLKTQKLQAVSDSGAKPEAGSRRQSTSMCMPSSRLDSGGRNAQLPQNEMLKFKFTTDLRQHMAHTEHMQPKPGLITRLSPHAPLIKPLLHFCMQLKISQDSE